MMFNFKGRRGAAVAAAVLGFLAWQGLTAFTSLDAGVEEELARRLRAEYAREHFQDLNRADLTDAKVDSILGSQKVSFESLTVVGTLDETVVRVEIRVDGRAPADGKAVRYYRMSYRIPSGWRIRSETGAFTYYTAFF
jgi:hypothetical protein